MTLGWKAEGDFVQVVDTLESVTLKKVGCIGEVTMDAWRFSDKTIDEPGTEGAVRRSEAVWQLPFIEGTDPPSVGDRLIDSAGTCWTVVEVDQFRGETRRRCLTRRIALRADVAEWMDLEIATWKPIVPEPPTGPELEIMGWQVVRPALRACATRIETAPDSVAGEPAVQRYRITLTEPIEATPNYRLRSHAGRAFRIIEQTIKDQLGEGWRYEAILETE